VNENRIQFLGWLAVGVLGVGICVALNALLAPATAQFDLTQDRRYTIPPALARIAQTKIDPEDPDARVKITVYLSESLPRYIDHLPRTISTRLNELRQASGGKVEYEFVDPKDDIDLMTELSEKYKITPLQLQDVREGEITQGSYYLSMVLRFKDQVEQLGLRDLGMELMKEERTLAALPGLLAARLLKVTTPPDEVVVGIASDKKPPPPQQTGNPEDNKPTDGLKQFRERLKGHVHVKDVALKGGSPVPSDVKTLILYKPEALTPLEVFQLDQFLMRGGRIIALVDTVSCFDVDRLQAINQALQQDGFALRPVETGLAEWLAFYGIVLKPGVVMDRVNHKIARFVPVAGSPFPKQEVGDIPGLVNVREQDSDKKPTGQLDPDEITLAGIGALAFLLPAPMEVDQAAFARGSPGAQLQVLARTSPEAWVVKEGTSVSMTKAVPPPREDWRQSVLVARASGQLRSFWSDKEVPARPGVTPEGAATDATKLTVAPADRPAQLWVIADTDFVVDGWMNFFARGGAIQAAQAMGVSASMVLNMADVAALGPDLVEIRRQRLIDRSVDEAAVKRDRGKILLMNLGLMPAIFVVLGMFWWVFRSAQTFVPSPRQPVTVPTPSAAAAPQVPEASVTDPADSHP
jgi:hypothetical protein